MLIPQRKFMVIIFVGVLALVLIVSMQMNDQFLVQNKRLEIQSKNDEPPTIEKEREDKPEQPSRRPLRFTIDRHPNDTMCAKTEVSVNQKRLIYQDLLRKWVTIAKENNISYVLSAGSLLGQYRDGDMIPWDRDADVLISSRDFKTLLKIASPRNFVQGRDSLFHMVVHEDFMVEPPKPQKRYSCSGKLVPRVVDECSFIGPAARLLKGNRYLDVFALKLLKDGRGIEPYKKKIFKFSDVFPEKACYFMDILTSCPSNTMNILNTFYSSLAAPYNYCQNGRWVKRKT